MKSTPITSERRIITAKDCKWTAALHAEPWPASVEPKLSHGSVASTWSPGRRLLSVLCPRRTKVGQYQCCARLPASCTRLRFSEVAPQTACRRQNSIRYDREPPGMLDLFRILLPALAAILHERPDPNRPEETPRRSR